MECCFTKKNCLWWQTYEQGKLSFLMMQIFLCWCTTSQKCVSHSITDVLQDCFVVFIIHTLLSRNKLMVNQPINVWRKQSTWSWHQTSSVMSSLVEEIMLFASGRFSFILGFITSDYQGSFGACSWSSVQIDMRLSFCSIARCGSSFPYISFANFFCDCISTSFDS